MSNSYLFTEDWFAHNIPNFIKYLSCYKGTNCHFLEIGCFEGMSAIWLLENILNKESTLTCVEPGYSLGNNDILKYNLSLFNNTLLIEKPNNVACFDYLFNKYDFVYVDGSHSSKSCLFDIIMGLTVLKPGGILAIDDYLWPDKDPDGSSPKEAVDYLFANIKGYSVLHKGYQVWLQKD